MTRSVLKQLIREVIVESREKKLSRVAESYITSSTDSDISLFVNIRIDADDEEEAEKLRKELLKTLKDKFDVKALEYK